MSVKPDVCSSRLEAGVQGQGAGDLGLGEDPLPGLQILFSLSPHEHLEAVQSFEDAVVTGLRGWGREQTCEPGQEGQVHCPNLYMC